MANNNDGQIVLGLDIPKTVSQINDDIKKLQSQLDQVKATGALDTSATIKQINSQILALQGKLQEINIQANVDVNNNTAKKAQQSAQQLGQKIGDTVEKSVQQSLSIDDVIDKQVTDLMAKYSIAGKKGSKAFEEIRQAVVNYRKELVSVDSAFDSDDIFDIFSNSADIRKVTSALTDHMKVADATKDTYASLAEYIKHVNNSGTKIHLPESIRQEYGDDFSSMRSQLGKAFTTGQGGDFESFITELNGQLGNVIDMSQGAESAFGDLVQKVNSAKGGNFLSGDELFKQGYLDRSEIERDITSAIDIIEEEEKKLAQTSTAVANTVVQNEQKKQQAYQQTAKVQSSVDNHGLDISDNERKIEQFKDSLEELGTVDSKYVDKLSERFEKLGIQIQSINASLSEVAVHEKGEYKGTKEILSTTLRGLDKNGQAITLMESWDLTNHEFVRSLDGVGASFENVSKYITDYQIKLNNLKTKYSNLDMDYSGFEEMLANFGKGIGTIDDLRLSFNNLENTAKSSVQSLKSQTSSFDPIQQTLNNMRDLPSMLTALEANMSGIKDKTSIAEISISDLRKTFSELETEMTNSGGKVPLTDKWLVKYRELMSTVTSATKQVDALKKAEASDNSQTQNQANYYSTILSNYREIYSLKQKLLTAGKEETKVIQEQIRSLNSSNASINKQLGKQGLKDSNWQTQVDDLKEELDYSLRISEARQKDKANQSSLNNAQREAIQIVEELEQAYQKVQDIKIKIASLDKAKDVEKISTLSQEEESAQTEYKQLYDRLRKRKNYDKESWNETKSAIDSATQSAIEYNNSRAQDNLNKAQKTEVSNFNILKDKWEEQGVLVGEFKTKVENMESALASVGSKGELDNLKLQIKDLRTEADKIAKVNEIQLSFDNGHGDSEYKNRIQSLVNDFERYGLSVEEANKKTANLRTILDGFKVDGNFLPDDQLVAQADKLEAEFKAVKVSLNSAKLSYNKFLQPVSSEKASSLIIRINDFITKNTAITKEAKEELQGFIRLLQNGNVNLSDWNKFDLRLKEINQEMRVAGKLGKSLKQTLIDGAKSFAQWTFSSGVVMEVWQGLKRVYNESLKINDVMTDLAMSTDLTASQMESVVDKYSNLGEKLNATTSEMIASGTEWIKQGQSIADTETLITSAMVLDKVGKLENAQATEYLTSAMKGYKVAVEDTMDIVDKLSAVDMASATNVGGLAEAMSQVANNANLAGVSMDKLLGYIAVIGETTGEGMSSVGTGLNAIFSRMGNIKLARLKDYQNSEGVDLSNVETVLRGEGISLRESTGEFRNFGEVLDEVASNWEDYSEVSQRAIASAFAGTNHMEQFLVLMEGYGKATEYTEKSLNSSGEAMQKFEDYQKSVTAHTELFNKSIQDLARTAVDSGLVNFFIDMGTGAIKFLDATTKLLTPLGTLGTILGAGLGIKNAG